MDMEGFSQRLNEQLDDQSQPFDVYKSEVVEVDGEKYLYEQDAQESWLLDPSELDDPTGLLDEISESYEDSGKRYEEWCSHTSEAVVSDQKVIDSFESKSGNTVTVSW